MDTKVCLSVQRSNTCILLKIVCLMEKKCLDGSLCLIWKYLKDSWVENSQSVRHQSLSHLPLRKSESLKRKAEEEFQRFSHLQATSVFWHREADCIVCVCQSFATTVLDPQQHNAQQLCTKLWERLDGEPMKKMVPVERDPGEGWLWVIRVENGDKIELADYLNTVRGYS